MKLLILAALLSFTYAGVLPQQGYSQQATSRQSNEKFARVLSASSDLSETGYRFNYETENGIKADENGQESDGIQAQGVFHYTGDDGQVYSISYTAGANGFQPQGAHIPTPPPIPEDILKALEQNARDEAAGINDDGFYNPAKYGDNQINNQQHAYKPQGATRYG